MRTLLLSNEDVQRVVRSVGVDRLMDELIERLEDALLRFDPLVTETPIRTGFHYDAPIGGMVEWMPVMTRGKEIIVKIVGYHPDNPITQDLPTVLSTICAYDTTNGHLTAIVDGTLLTAMRTGAASAIASRRMARPESRCLGLIGCGAQAVTQLHALTRVFSLQEVLLHDADPATVESFPARVAGFLPAGIDIRTASADEIVAQSDIVSVATSVQVGQGPVFQCMDTKPWLHVNAVGSDFPGKTELPRALLKQSFVCADTMQQARVEGECQQLDPEDIHAEIADVVRGAHDIESTQQRRTVFDSTGWALQDQVAVDLAMDKARELGLGTEVSIECIGDDPRDPYEFLGGVAVVPIPAPPVGKVEASEHRGTGSRSSG